ncbi:shikimate dehydrogenase [Spirosomataceae bacterium TFI 002]|nr:shikimate dehydrogenase [Spirosomataceae bacterium TFI 002]
MKKYGLIGFPLTHSFSKKYFTEKFEKIGLSHTHQYDLYEIENATDLLEILNSNPEIDGINVTIPHKQSVMPLLSSLDQSAEKVGAVNVIKKTSNGLIGYNSDYYGFRKSLLDFLNGAKVSNAMILGYGGAAKAVKAVLKDLGIFVTVVSRQASDTAISYEEANSLLSLHHLIINCSPVGTYPNADQCPSINYKSLSTNHFLFDLVYNPTETLFMKNGLEMGAKVKNGYDMLVHQAEKSWEIWNQ